MAASHTLSHSLAIRKSGVLVLSGYGIRVQVNSGHLVAHDGIADERRTIRLPRVGHGLRRLVMIGSDGFITLEALRWLADQDAAFVMLERDGSVLVTTGPVRPSDVRLRRAQALANQSGVAYRIVQELMSRKLFGQELLVRNNLNNSLVAHKIARLHSGVKTAETIPALRHLEAQAAYAYWSAWRDISIVFPKNDLSRVPHHWRRFGSRHSPLTGSPRLAVNPPNAILNYLYALLESEARLAIAALGLDPGMGMLHVDSPSRDSLACDLMEVVRPQVDSYLLDWIVREPLHRQWFIEQSDGNCRLMAPFAMRLSETAPTWGRAVAPIAEWVSRTLWSTMRKPTGQAYPATRLTQSRRRQAKGSSFDARSEDTLRPLCICRICGATIKRGHTYCASCAVGVSREGLIEAAKLGRIATHSRQAEALRAKTQRKHAAALAVWKPSELPEWLNEQAYRTKIQPALGELTVPAIKGALGVSEPYATDIRAGRRIPHPRHWLILSRLIGVSTTDS
jgi:CRISPR-associated endonuclease Cas1